MKIIKLLLIYFSCLVIATASIADDSKPVEPFSIPLEQMKKGITNLISSVNELKEQIRALEEQNAQLTNSLQGLEVETKKQVGKIEKEMLGIVQAYEEVTSEMTQLQSTQEGLDSRMKALEDLILIGTIEKNILLGQDGSAIIFKVNELEEFSDQLPTEEKCSEFGSVLENFPARSLNAFFVMSNNDTIALCKLEYGMSNWSISAASIADRGHVITNN